MNSSFEVEFWTEISNLNFEGKYILNKIWNMNFEFKCFSLI